MPKNIREETPLVDIAEAFESTATIKDAADFIEVTPKTLYAWMDKEEQIKELAEAQRQRREVDYEETQRITVRVPKFILDKLKARAEVRGVSLSQIVIEKLGLEL